MTRCRCTWITPPMVAQRWEAEHACTLERDHDGPCECHCWHEEDS